MTAVLARLKDLWAGRLRLADAFWTYAVFWGLLFNIAATLAAFAIVVAAKAAAGGGDGGSLAALAALAVHLLPLPYNVVSLVGVWRSAGRPDIPAPVSLAARTVTVALFVLFTVV